MENKTVCHGYKLEEGKFTFEETFLCEGGEALAEGLAKEVENAPTLTLFKAKLDKALSNLV